MKSTRAPVVHRETALLREFVSLRRDAWVKRAAESAALRKRRAALQPLMPTVAAVAVTGRRRNRLPDAAD